MYFLRCCARSTGPSRQPTRPRRFATSKCVPLTRPALGNVDVFTANSRIDSTRAGIVTLQAPQDVGRSGPIRQDTPPGSISAVAARNSDSVTCQRPPLRLLQPDERSLQRRWQWFRIRVGANRVPATAAALMASCAASGSNSRSRRLTAVGEEHLPWIAHCPHIGGAGECLDQGANPEGVIGRFEQQPPCSAAGHAGFVLERAQTGGGAGQLAGRWPNRRLLALDQELLALRAGLFLLR